MVVIAAIGRAAAALAAFVATYFFSFWMLFVQVIEDLPLAANLASLAAGIAAAVWLWSALGNPNRGVVSIVLIWTLALGAIGFIGGFFGPMLLAPDANQGPLLGLFVTGPLGLVAGAVVGVVHGLARRFRFDVT